MTLRDLLHLPDRLIPGEGARLMPQARIGGPMPWVIAIMVALTVLAVGAALALDNVAKNAGNEIAGGLTVQIVEGAPQERSAQTQAALEFLGTHPNVRSIREVPPEELEALLEPWLGADSADNEAFASPSLIDVQLGEQVTVESLRSLRAQLAEIAPDARLDAQANWLVPVFEALRSLQFLALGLVLLLTVTAAAAVWLAARSALSNNSDVIDVIHHLGGTDGQIANVFQRSVAIDAGVGGLAGLFLGLAAIMLLGEQFAALGSGLVSGGGLGPVDWGIIIAVPLVGIVLAMLTARLTVMFALRKML